jgi:hypothetical protein
MSIKKPGFCAYSRFLTRELSQKTRFLTRELSKTNLIVIALSPEGKGTFFIEVMGNG